MADYADLMNLEKKVKKQPVGISSQSPIQESQKPPLSAPSKPSLEQQRKEERPENLKTRKPETATFVKATKYSTQLEPHIIKQIKQYAIEHDEKDYEIVQRAIKEFFANNK
jgi:hypothetical protein